MITYTQFYPRYFDDNDIDADIEIIRSTKNYDQYKLQGGFLDKLTYFEVLSTVRENRKHHTGQYSRKFDNATISLGRKVTLKDKTGQEYVMEFGDRIRAKRKF